MRSNLEHHAAQRDAMLEQVILFLQNDQRFVAAWLTGSFGTNTADAMSDLDLTIVVANHVSAELCERSTIVQAGTNHARLALVRRFGNPVVIHENHYNAPNHATFTAVLYDSGMMIDWILMPHHAAQRPHDSRLLFEKATIPSLEPPRSNAQLDHMREQEAFFWMMAAITAKYIIRHDSVFVTQWLEHLTRIKDKFQQYHNGRTTAYQRGSLSPFLPTSTQQQAYLLDLCRIMQRLTWSDDSDEMRFNTVQKLLGLAHTDD